MDAKTLTALQGSIAKWQGIVAGTIEDQGTMNCPLCVAFYHLNCEGCAVHAVTGITGCGDTPYNKFGKSGQSTEVAQEELDFLRSLLPAPSLTSPVETPNG